MEFTSKPTQITFTNEDGESFIVREGDDDADILEFRIREDSFWMSKIDAKDVARTILNMANEDLTLG